MGLELELPRGKNKEFPEEEGVEWRAEVGGVRGGGEGPPGKDDGVLVRGEREQKPDGGPQAALVFLVSLTFPFPPSLMTEVMDQRAMGPCRRALCLSSAAWSWSCWPP